MSQNLVRILVVDSERFYREAIHEVLAALHPCMGVEDGRTALEVAQDRSVGVVFLNVRLPDLDGCEVLRQLQEMRPELRVIMLAPATEIEPPKGNSSGAAVPPRIVAPSASMSNAPSSSGGAPA